MNILTKRASNFDELRISENNQHLHHLLPPLNELIFIANLKNIEMFIYYAYDNSTDVTIGAAVFFQEIRNIDSIKINTFSLLGYDYFDYNFFFCKNDHLAEFLKYISRDAKKYNVDAIVIENTISLQNKKDANRVGNYIFDSSSDFKEKKFDTLLRKKSLKRHFNKMNREFNYSCTHVASVFSQKDIEMLAEIHKERWNYSEKKSAFLREERTKLYLGYKNNKVLTAIRNGDDIIAIHYGMILGDVFLWHTPTINIKYLEFSPLEVLLFEVVRYCQASNFTILDLGLGDEKYKNRFSNSYQSVYNLFLPLTIKGIFCKYRMPTKRLKSPLVNLNRKIQARISHTLTIGNKINYYYFPHDHATEIDLLKEAKNYNLLVIRDFKSLVEIFRNAQIETKERHYNRIKSGCILLCLTKNNLVFSYGWATRQPIFFVSEIQKNICNQGNLMLFDFSTPQKFRKQGYYTKFLKAVCLEFKKERVVCFAESKNIYSNKGIIRAGFLRTDYKTI